MSGDEYRRRRNRCVRSLSVVVLVAAALSSVGGLGEAGAVDCVVASSAPQRKGAAVQVVHVVRCDRPISLGAAQVIRDGRVVASQRWSPPLDAGLHRLRQRVPLRCGAQYRGRYFADGWRYGPARRFCPFPVTG